MKNELIRDRIIVGVLDDAVSDRLRAKTDLTLDEEVNMSRQSEARKQSKEFPQLFTGLGKVQTECHITLRGDAQPFCLYTPRKVAHPLLPKVKKKIDSVHQLIDLTSQMN